ncbi:hypothetical protein [Apilactobacillus kunkeei]|uniref:hypothetical protein n=1 Tax=Apilactobacillus kunkeei TaxID=148814 RepID=UPI00200A8386|nr:hypothetical protein [Apilactobacillus kunkeei]MCK8626655.1 hypothetical protein [Apilactobacillus kunkeei]
MQKNNVFKLAIIFLLTLVISTATVIPAATVHASADNNGQQENASKVISNDSMDQATINYFVDNNGQNFYNDLTNNLAAEGKYPEGLELRGFKSAMEKVSIKAMLIAMKRIGKKAWDAAVKKVIEHIPAKKSVKKALFKFLKFKTLIRLLNVAFNIDGKIEDILTDVLYKGVHIPRFIAGIIARGVVEIAF